CPACQGVGLVNNRLCPECRGIGLGLWQQGVFVFWGKQIDGSQIVLDKIQLGIKNIINGAFLLFGILGFLLLVWKFTDSHGWLMDNFSLFWQQFYNTKDWRLLLFWLSLAGDFYLVYRFDRELNYRSMVLKKDYNQAVLPNEALPTWQEAKSLTNKFRLDIAGTFMPEAIGAVDGAWQTANRFNSGQVEPIHLLAALLRYGKTSVMLSRLGVSFPQLKEKISRGLSVAEPAQNRPVFSLVLKKILLQAYEEAYNQQSRRVDLPDLMVALAGFPSPASDILYDLEIDLDKVKNVAQWLRVQKLLRQNWQKFRRRAQLKPKGAMNRAMTAIATPFLDTFSQDLTALARAGYLEPCLNREKELEAVYRIIEGGNNSAVLVGNIGVGKMTILNGLAQRMAAEEVPILLKDKRLVNLSVAKLVSGATPAEAGERLLNIVDEVIRSGNIILVISNIQEMIGITSGRQESLDLAEVLVSALEKKYFFCLATADSQTYRQYIEGSALGGILEKVEIAEMGPNQAIQVLEAKTGPLEYKNKVYFSYSAIEKTVQLADRYLHERYLPAKAIGILEEVAVQVRKKKGENSIIVAEDVAEIVAEKTNIPLTKIGQDESQKLLNLEDRIHQRMIDQEPAVKMVSAALRRARAELRDNQRPIVNLLFLGPTGVGKTELAKTVAEVYFGSEEQMIRLDMSEYQEQSAIDKLIGVSGQKGGGYLTEAVRRSPFSLLLLDEIEKAHPDILNIFLQVMDDGRLTDNQGRTVDFTNVILIATSNAGTQIIQDKLKQGVSIDVVKDQLLAGELKNYFRPEFLNRFDGVIVFKPLSLSDVEQIAGLMLKKVSNRLLAKGINFQAAPEAIKELAQAGFDPVYGARPLRRVIQEKVDDILANYLLQNKIGRRDAVILQPGGWIKVEKADQL
ncbi:MAG: ATP-dependent Clp protease ATP-binding subunit, partial [bacterium]